MTAMNGKEMQVTMTDKDFELDTKLLDNEYEEYHKTMAQYDALTVLVSKISNEDAKEVIINEANRYLDRSVEQWQALCEHSKRHLREKFARIDANKPYRHFGRQAY